MNPKLIEVLKTAFEILREEIQRDEKFIAESKMIQDRLEKKKQNMETIGKMLDGVSVADERKAY